MAKRTTKLARVLKEERLTLVEIQEEMQRWLDNTINQNIDNPEDKIPAINLGNLSMISTGNRWKIKEITALRIKMTINRLRQNKKDEYTLIDLFESDRFLFNVTDKNN